ncbi:FAD-binding domain-containing protein [Teratosphaeria nubilosa]|uniref:FAD-binding domain-containing protein n=1 Tax=Teratosphaeria nubilosa TaxID=161662 RepID=A0A6G1KUY9_9PEZI|nr:FAD-binding domain-containing protein [Teratosphaeria nubilosa]
MPNTTDYTAARTGKYATTCVIVLLISCLAVWSETCVNTPYCVFQPASATELADGLKILVWAKTRFAVRSQGHMPVPLANGIDNGVFISTSFLNKNRLINNNSIVQIGPGQPWASVYEYVSPYGLGVAGGRFSPVGVGGLLLGGGINYFGSQIGWSCSAVVNYEIVLANSTIVCANKTTNPDLFWALKGGGNNFGIVTRFDVKTYPVTRLYGGTTIFAAANCNAFLDAVSSYVLPGGGSYDDKSAILPDVNLDPATNTSRCSLVAFYDGATSNPVALANFTAIPAASTDNSIRMSFVNYTNETNTPVYASRASRWMFASTAAKISIETVPLLNKTFTDSVLAAMTKLTNTSGTSASLAMQPITVALLQAARDAGGDAINLDPADGPFLSILITLQWSDAADDATVHSIAQDFICRLEEKTKSMELYYPFKYMNDAMRGQEIYKAYGGGKSLPKLKAIQSAYDPAGVFAQFENSGFKL